ncbi:Crp/Fnr family transcriptional regulator [Sphingoaurantiacus capsulatus]|uniref:Crp/Fnr family transcriptional regulator n=1 Tax=Sphingoaurantiacus capsulatus TaxID=1771310 RepID=A0ABV7XA43_9SPHN
MNHACADCAVRESALCASLNDDELSRLNRIGRRQRLAKGQTLQFAGDDSLVFANVVDGVLKLSTSTADGREQIVGLLYPADFLGRLFAVRVDYDCTALTDADLCVFPRAGFEAALNDFQKLERDLLERTMAELDRTRQWMLLLGRKSAEEKVASFLLNIAERLRPEGCTGRSDGPQTYVLPLTRGQIADVLGLTIETVSRQMTRLKSAGVIALPSIREVTLLRPDLLEAMAEAT